MIPREELARRLALTVVTDARVGEGRTVVDVVRAALRGGAPAVQLRAKTETARETVELARVLREETRAAGALLFVNDRVDIALVADADGAHVGDEDIPVAAARRIVPPGFLLGRSADTPEEAIRAREDGANYVGVGPVYETASKDDAGSPVGLARITAVARVAGIPVVGIGGISEDNAAAVARAGADGVAVIRAVMAAPDPGEAVRRLLGEVERGRASR
ncbi:MAG TPA: thiamine phosphate synthase [Longimicrobiaceae bacterium]|nr:thiamine phosphate synthase [Longimicrobiaceae bacterium]